MKKYKNLLFYIITICGFSLLMYLIIQHGAILENGKNIPVMPHTNAANWAQFTSSFVKDLSHPLPILLLQIITIILTARLFGFLCKKIGQPAVIGEIIAGIFLGPSFIGMYFPAYSTFLFPADSLKNLQLLSQLGLILFMFIVGIELDFKILKNKANEAVVISHASIIFPFTLGVGLAYLLYQHFTPSNINFVSFALFIGIAMSITAFPVLARIVQERGLSKTKLGTIVITCAAADDISAWCILAAVIAIVKAGTFVNSIYTILLAIAYVIIMLKLVQPFLKKVGDRYSNRESLSKPVVALFFITLLVSAYLTETIGIHALFGAFMAGVIMPPNMNFRNVFIEKIEDVSIVLLLPLFFVFTGLRTEIGLLNDVSLWAITALIITVAVIGKFTGSALAAKFVGQSWRDSLMIGALMNTRGLMELVVLNIGYDIGVLSPEVFTMMVIMALVTTFMTGPALSLINRFLPEKKSDFLQNDIEKAGKYKILISFDNPLKGVSMLRLAHSLIKKSLAGSSITALHLSPGNELNQFNSEEYERDSFLPLENEAKKLHQPIITQFKPSLDIDKEIVETANIGHFDLMMIGIGSSVFEGTWLGKILGFTTKIVIPERIYDTLIGKEKLFENTLFDESSKHIIKFAKVPIGILIERNLLKVEKVFLPIYLASDIYLLSYAQRLIHHNESQVIVLDMSGIIKENAAIKEGIRAIEQTAPNHIALYNDKKIDTAFLMQQDLMMISIDSWKILVESSCSWLPEAPSIFILKA